MRLRLDGWDAGETAHGDDRDFTTRTTLTAPVDGELLFEGLATLCTVIVDGEVVAESESMFVPVRVPVGAGEHEVEVRCAALTPRLAERRKPRARWRQKVAYDGNLRWFRTTLLGRAPGFAPGPPVVGLWRPAWLVAGEPSVSIRCRVDGSDGVVAAVSSVDGVLTVGEASLAMKEGVPGELRVPGVRLWWPHTHGEPNLYEATFTPSASDNQRKALEITRGWSRRVGFRTLEAVGDVLSDGLSLSLNDCPLFVRGALWTPTPEGEERHTLEAARDAGLNAIRLPGTGVYETAAFHDLCDELGLLVWQDLMFANLDYPFEVPEFHAQVTAELDALVETVGGRPSLAVVCGGSEIEQQVAMLGLDPALGRPEFLGEEVPERLRAADVDAVYVPSAPCGEHRPLLPHEGVSNWFAVGGYRRPLAEARTAGVRFASECLAIANVPDDPPADRTEGVMRDVDSPWDFADVRDHYLQALYGVGVDDLLSADAPRYVALSSTVSGDVMAHVLGEWRREGSPCAGAFILWLRDLRPGAGWGLLDHRGRPKAVLGALRRVLAPVAVWMTDEGMGGLAVHVANDRPRPLEASLRLTVYREGEHVVEEAATPVSVPGHAQVTRDAETVLGRWVDVSYAYRFGEPGHDLVVAALEGPAGELIASYEHEPLGRSPRAWTAAELGVSAVLEGDAVRISARRALIGARLTGCRAAEDGFVVEPGRDRVVAVRDVERPALTARNLLGAVAC